MFKDLKVLTHNVQILMSFDAEVMWVYFENDRGFFSKTQVTFAVNPVFKHFFIFLKYLPIRLNCFLEALDDLHCNEGTA